MPELHDYINVSQDFELIEEVNYCSILRPAFKNKLHSFLEFYLKIQKKENHPTIPFDAYSKFPNIESEIFKHETFSRKQDVVFVEKYINENLNVNSKVLEIGGWNGWLTQRLFNYCKNLVSVDIFTDEKNGLSSKKHHTPNNLLSVQADLTEPGIFKNNFDLIVFNHCLQFYPQPFSLLEQYQKLLKPNGSLILLGVDTYLYSFQKQKQVMKLKSYYQRKYQFDIYFYNCDGFFDRAFLNQLIKNNYKFNVYKFSLISKFKKKFLGQKSGILIFKNHQK
jgi:2-polyprenyl-3-methyl-5-hydroxy-6-metoxy-1,4-benzoquinol methylase